MSAMWGPNVSCTVDHGGRPCPLEAQQYHQPGSTAYCGDNCNHTGPHRYPPGVALAEQVAHRHVWVYDGTDSAGISTYHCDFEDPPQVRRVALTTSEPVR